MNSTRYISGQQSSFIGWYGVDLCLPLSRRHEPDTKPFVYPSGWKM